VSHEATKPKRPGGSFYHGDVYAAGGCIRGTASCAFSVVPDGTWLWAEIQFPGLRPGLFSVVPDGTGFGLRSSSQDCVLGYSLSSLTGLGFWVEMRFPGLRPGLLSVVPDGTGFWAEMRFPGLASWATLCRP
jgi:hypothetical protein